MRYTKKSRNEGIITKQISYSVEPDVANEFQIICFYFKTIVRDRKDEIDLCKYLIFYFSFLALAINHIKAKGSRFHYKAAILNLFVSPAPSRGSDYNRGVVVY